MPDIARRPGRGTLSGAPPLKVQSLSRGLRAGPWGYPGIVSSDTDDPDTAALVGAAP